jgi:predicted O-methyltransferase YrrM
MNTLDRIRELWPQLPLRGRLLPWEIADVGRDDLAQLFNHLDFKVGVEVGTEYGLYAETLCKAAPRLKLYSADPYKAYKGYREHRSQQKLNGIYEQAQERMYPYNHEFICKPSIEAAADFKDGSLDFVYIDGNHSLLHVIQDLCYWVPKVRKDGIVAGHDFIRRDHTGYAMHVCQALHAYTQSYGIKPWYVLGSKAVRDGEVRDKPRSWMWVKS